MYVATPDTAPIESHCPTFADVKGLVVGNVTVMFKPLPSVVNANPDPIGSANSTTIALLRMR